MARTAKTLLKWLLALVVLGGGIFAAVHFLGNGAEKSPEYKSTAIARGDLTQVVTATGQLNPLLNVQVGSQISGTIQKILADFNSQVKEGEIIAQLDPATYQASVHQNEGDLANANAGLELARVTARRDEELLKSKLIPQADYDKAMADLHQAEAQVKIKEATLERSKVDLGRCTIYAPINGVVISRNVDVGQTVAASFNTPTLFQIANDLTKMQIDANVSEADVGEVALDQDVTFSVDAFPSRTFHGKVKQVRNAPITVQNVVTYDTVVEVSNPDLKLKPGMTANVSIVIAHRENVLKIPNAAFRFRPPEPGDQKKTATSGSSQSPFGGGGFSAMAGMRGGSRGGGSGEKPARRERSPIRTVYLPTPPGADGEPKPPKPVQVKVGVSDSVSTEVIEGLNEGDNVIVGMTTTGAAGAPSGSPFGGGMRMR